MKLQDFFDHSGDQPLNEETYKELTSLIDPNFLRQGYRAAQLRSVQVDGFNDGNIQRPDTLHFTVLTPSHAYEWPTYVRFVEWVENGSDKSLNVNERARLLIWAGNIQVHCECPSYIFWGYQYILTQIDAAIIYENRAPDIRNPQRRGIVCKHLNRVLKSLPFHLGDVAREIKAQFG